MPLDDFSSWSIAKKCCSMLYFYVYIATQIVLESFPVSSSSHLVLLERYLNRYGFAIDHRQGFFFDFLHFDLVSIDVLDHFLHGVTALVILVFFFPQWRIFFTHFSRYWRYVLTIGALTALADSLTLVLYLARGSLLFACPTLGIGFVITALLLFSLRFVSDKQTGRLTWRTACVLGFVQGLALLPGISRFASTYVVARWLAFTPRRAFEVSFLIQWPLITLAFANSVRMLAMQSNSVHLFSGPLFLVMVGAGIVAFWVLRFVRTLADAQRLWLFSIYMLFPLMVWAWLC